MTIAGDTEDLISTDLWGETVTIVRNDPNYNEAGFPLNIWDTVVVTHGDIQRISGNNPTRNLGQGRISSHTIFLPDATAIIQGDRIRSSEWDTGKAEFEVQSVMVEEGHVELRTRLVRTSTMFLMLEDGTWIFLETNSEVELE